MGGVGGQPSPVERYGLDIERLVVWRQRPRWIEIVRTDPGYAPEEHDRQQRKGPGDKFDLAGLNKARLEVGPLVGRSVPPSEQERRENGRNDDRDHDQGLTMIPTSKANRPRLPDIFVSLAVQRWP